RLSLYKKIAGAYDEAQRDEVCDELLDRFGDLPSEAENLLDISLIRHMAGRLGVGTVMRQGDRLNFYFGENSGFNPAGIARLAEAYGTRLSVFGGLKPRLSVALGKLRVQKEALEILRLLSRGEGEC
ncbi:MAG TPA: hypothetical protein PL035_03995, partial [Bacillota bacterium]|nr:hypothetical protein [Bacillota bacterium]